jgi:hypothetical protein
VGLEDEVLWTGEFVGRIESLRWRIFNELCDIHSTAGAFFVAFFP